MKIKLSNKIFIIYLLCFHLFIYIFVCLIKKKYIKVYKSKYYLSKNMK